MYIPTVLFDHISRFRTKRSVVTMMKTNQVVQAQPHDLDKKTSILMSKIKILRIIMDDLSMEEQNQYSQKVYENYLS